MSYNKNAHQYNAIIYFIPGINTGLILVEGYIRVSSFHLKQSACSCLLFVANSMCMIRRHTKHTGIPTDNSWDFNTSWRERGFQKKEGPKCLEAFRISGSSRTQSELPFQPYSTIFWTDRFQLHKLVLKPFKTPSMLPQSGVCSCTQQAVILSV